MVLVLITLSFLLGACANISREKYNDELAKVINDNNQLYKYFNKPDKDPGGKNDANLKRILLDQEIEKAIFDYAVDNNKAWSIESILSSGWLKIFVDKGMLLLNDEDKLYMLQEIGHSIANLPFDQCTSFFGRNMSSIKFRTNDRFFDIKFEMTKNGAINRNKNFKAPGKVKLGVALVALIAKAKESMTDDEMENSIRFFINFKEANKDELCALLSKLFVLTEDIEPKYRNIIFDQLVFLRRETL